MLLNEVKTDGLSHGIADGNTVDRETTVREKSGGEGEKIYSRFGQSVIKLTIHNYIKTGFVGLDHPVEIDLV